MQQELINNSGNFSARVQKNMTARMGPFSVTPGGVPDPLAYFREFGQFGEATMQPMGYVQWVLMHILRAVWMEDLALAGDYAALLSVGIEQYVLDGGNWQVGWMMSLMEEPPPTAMARVPDRHQLRTFPHLADQAWSTTALAYLRELDTIQTRRRELLPAGRGTRPPRAPRPRSSPARSYPGGPRLSHRPRRTWPEPSSTA